MYSVTELREKYAVLEFYGAKLCVSYINFTGEIKETYIVKWDNNHFIYDESETKRIKSNYYERINNIKNKTSD